MQNFLWTHETLEQACKPKELHEACHGGRICIDSKEIEPGDIFIALKGRNLNGHDYALDALSRGATCAIVEYQPENLKSSDNLMIVSNTRIALKDLAVFNRSRSSAKIIAITGSVGKTSTREAMLLACSAHGKSYRSRKNFNNELGLPISLASMPVDTEYGIFELGMNHAGEIEELSKILKPHLALITKIAKVHVEHFRSIEDIAHAKGEIFLGMRNTGIAILNGDDQYCSLLMELATEKNIMNICCFGENPKNDSYLIQYESGKDGLNTITARICGNEITYHTKAIGKHQAVNTIAVLSAISKLGLDVGASAAALADFSNIAGRGKFLELKIGNKEILVIDDSYNANPTSVEAALRVIGELISEKYPRKVVVLGDMVDSNLGLYSEMAHAGLALPLWRSGVDKVVTVGPLMQHLFISVSENRQLKHFPDYKRAQANILELLESGDCILFKGANSTRIHEIVKYLQSKAA